MTEKPDGDHCWYCGGDFGPFCHGAQDEQIDVMDGQMDILEELNTHG